MSLAASLPTGRELRGAMDERRRRHLGAAWQQPRVQARPQARLLLRRKLCQQARLLIRGLLTRGNLEIHV